MEIKTAVTQDHIIEYYTEMGYPCEDGYSHPDDKGGSSFSYIFILSVKNHDGKVIEDYDEEAIKEEVQNNE